jgi:hypothetical protein
MAVHMPRVTGGLIGLTILLAGCSGTPASVSATTITEPPLPRAQITLPASAADPSCNGGRGGPLPMHDSASNLPSLLVRALSLPNGDVLIGTESDESPLSGQSARLVVSALSPNCTLDAKFGDHGVDTVDLPAASAHGYSTVNGWAPDGNGVVLAGATSTSGYVMRLAANGDVDLRFGTHGVAMLATPHPSSGGSQVDKVMVATRGQIIVGADDGNAPCCASTYVARLDPDGRLDRSFGSGGWSQALATGAVMQQVVARSDGSVLAVLSGIDTGGGTDDVYELNHQGSVVSSFSDDFGRALSDSTSTLSRRG